MGTHFLSEIDWRQPWLAPFLALVLPILEAADWRAALNKAAATANLHNQSGLPIRFVQQEQLPIDVAYESFISTTGQVPTRENLHDFFNALVWLRFPLVKARLNALQAAEITRTNGETRGKLRDAATIFDENAALLVSRNADLVDALRCHRWHETFVPRRLEFERDCEVQLFGHALMEKLVSPYKAITAHTWVIRASDAYFQLSQEQRRGWIDAAVAAQLAPGLVTSNFTPLPILGVPGWCERQDDAFYQDTTVFRPKRKVLA